MGPGLHSTPYVDNLLYMRRPNSIRGYLTALALVATLPLLGLWVFTAWSHLRFRQESSWQMVHQSAELTAVSVRQFVLDARQTLEAMASIPILKSLDTTQCDSFLENSIATRPQYSALVLSDSAGNVLCSSVPTTVRTTRDGSWFEVVSRTKDFSVGKPSVGKISGEWMSVFAVPVYGHDGRHRGYLSVSVTTERFQQILNIASLPEDVVISLTHTDGTIVARSRDPELWVGKQLSATESVQEDLDARERVTAVAEGDQYLWAWEDVPEVDWIVYSGIPSDWAFAQSLPGLSFGLTIGTALVVTVLLLASGVHRTVGRNLSNLVQGVRKANGAVFPIDETEVSEVAEVARQFNETLTERTRAETELRAAKELYQSVLQNAALGILVVREDGTVVEANSSLANVLGAGSVESLVALNHKGFYRDEEEWENVLRVLGGELEQHTTDTTWVRNDGEAFPVRLSVSRIRLRDGRQGGVILAEDLTERHELEEQIRQSQKLETVGRIAGGIAHDFNNRLMVILNCADSLHSKLRGTGLEDTANAILESAARSAELTGQLLAFSRRQISTRRIVDLNGLLREFHDMLRRGLEEDITIYTNLTERSCPVSVDSGQIEQVVLNLATNAGDAMPEGGELTLSTRIEMRGPQHLKEIQDSADSGYVVLAVSDTGMGMDEDTKASVFEPFFTTKAVGAGTGLGLSTAYGIVRQHDGHMQVFSEMGAGSTFEVWLLLADEDGLETRGHEVEVTEEKSVDHGTILVAEDDATVRNLIESMLERAGYDVLVASDGAEALALAKGFEGHIDALVTDWIMPGMRGPELAKRLTAERPSLQVLYISGYTDEQLGPGRFEFDPRQFLAKPFAREELLDRLRDLAQDAAHG